MRGFNFGAKFIVIGVMLFVLLSFNWDRTELEGRAFVVAIGIDAGDDEGERFEVSMSIADVAAMEGEGGDDVSILRVASGESLALAMGQIDAKISDNVYYGHTKAIVLGKCILEDESLLREVIDTLQRKNEINIKCIVMAADQKAAKDMLEAKPREQGLLGLYLSGFYNNHNANAAAHVLKLDLEGLTEGMRDTQSAVIPKIALEDDEVAISGVAVLRGFELAGTVDDEEMAGFLWIMGDAIGTQIAIEAGKSEGHGHITFLAATSRTKLSFKELDGRLHCIIKIKTEGSIEGARFMEDYLYNTATMLKLQKNFATKIQNEIESTINIFQQDLAVDGFGIKEQLRKKDWRLYQKYNDQDWQDTFKDMQFTINVDVTIRNAGSVK